MNIQFRHIAVLSLVFLTISYFSLNSTSITDRQFSIIITCLAIAIAAVMSVSYFVRRSMNIQFIDNATLSLAFWTSSYCNITYTGIMENEVTRIIMYLSIAGAGLTSIPYFTYVTIKFFSSNRESKKIISAPGEKSVKLLKFLVPKKAYDEIFAQVVADMRDEYFSALAEGNLAKARWIRVRDTFNLAIVFVQFLIATCVDRGVKIYKTFSSK